MSAHPISLHLSIHLTTRVLTSVFSGAIANSIIQGKANDPAAYVNSQEDLGINITGSFLPDTYGRIFHVTKYGNSIMAKNIINAITNEQAKLMNMPAIRTTVWCQVAVATIKPTSSAPPAPTNSLECHVTANDRGGVARDEAVKAVKGFCEQPTSPKRSVPNLSPQFHLLVSWIRKGPPIFSFPGCVNEAFP